MSGLRACARPADRPQQERTQSEVASKTKDITTDKYDELLHFTEDKLQEFTRTNAEMISIFKEGTSSLTAEDINVYLLEHMHELDQTFKDAMKDLKVFQKPALSLRIPKSLKRPADNAETPSKRAKTDNPLHEQRTHAKQQSKQVKAKPS